MIQDRGLIRSSDDANFINFCEGQDLTNGEQKEGGSCNGIRTSHFDHY